MICGVMFAQIEAGQTRAIRITDATKAALAVLVAVVHTKVALPVTALVAVAVAVAVMWVAMLLMARGGPRASGAGNLLHDMVTRFMGLIVLAMGVQFALTGFHDFFTAHP